jgi:hypothetical protein
VDREFAFKRFCEIKILWKMGVGRLPERARAERGQRMLWLNDLHLQQNARSQLIAIFF